MMTEPDRSSVPPPGATPQPVITPRAALLHAFGKLQHQRGDRAASLLLFEQAAQQCPGFALAENDLGVALHAACRHDEALAAFDRALATDPNLTPAQCNRGLVLIALGRRDEAEPAFRAICTRPANTAGEWRYVAIAAQHLGDRDAAEAAWRRTLALNPADDGARLALAALLEGTQRPGEAREHYVAWVAKQQPRLQRCVAGRPLARVLLIAATGTQNTPVHFHFPAERFDVITTYLLPQDHPGSAMQAERLNSELPDCDIVFNAVGDADLGAEYLPRVTEICRGRKRPVLNPPSTVPPTRRDRIGTLLDGIPGLIVPATRRLTRAELAAVAEVNRPVLLRTAGSHGGSDLTRADSAADIEAYLGRVAGETHYVTDFHDYAGADGRFRKYRFAFIDRKVFAYHLAIGEDWLVHYWRTPMREAWMKREEEAFLADYEAGFGAAAETVRAVARRLDLDCAGMDCALTRDGQVLLFEANATMNLQLADSRAEYPYKHLYVPRIRTAMEELVWRRCDPATYAA